MDEQGVAPEWRMPDEMWERIEPLVPKLRKNPKGGRPISANLIIADGVDRGYAVGHANQGSGPYARRRGVDSTLVACGLGSAGQDMGRLASDADHP
jgi:hypothetical protein